MQNNCQKHHFIRSLIVRIVSPSILLAILTATMTDITVKHFTSVAKEGLGSRAKMFHL